MQANPKWWVTISWMAFGATMLALPPAVYFASTRWGKHFPGLMTIVYLPSAFNPSTPFAAYEWWGSLAGWWQLIPLALAWLSGALLSCVWIGWYFAVCLGFNGHNNEAGGAARIEQYKQFISFRLTENDLTGYVIAVKDPKQKGRELTPQVIDVFRLMAKRPEAVRDPTVGPGQPATPASVKSS